MAEEESLVVGLHDDFYRDSFGKVVSTLAAAGVLIAALIALSTYLYLSKPPPITFRVADEWRVQPPVPIEEPYLSNAEVLQWVSNVVPDTFDLGFLHIDTQLEGLKQFFTVSGYEVYLNQLNNYIDKTKIERNKMFLHAEPTAAPSVKNQGVLNGRYAWWVKIPVQISYAGMIDLRPVILSLDVLVVRTKTTNNLMGVLIDNVIVDTDAGLTQRRTL